MDGTDEAEYTFISRQYSFPCTLVFMEVIEQVKGKAVEIPVKQIRRAQ